VNSTYVQPDGTVVIMPPGMTQVVPVPVELPCDQDPNQERCRTVGVTNVQVYWHGAYRGGFGGFFGGHGGYGG
jgi:hypothetical protein